MERWTTERDTEEYYVYRFNGRPAPSAPTRTRCENAFCCGPWATAPKSLPFEERGFLTRRGREDVRAMLEDLSMCGIDQESIRDVEARDRARDARSHREYLTGKR